GLDDLLEIAGNLVARGTRYGQGRDALVRLDVDFDPSVTIPALADHAVERDEGNARRLGRAIAPFRPGEAALVDELPEAHWWRGAVDQPPRLCTVGTHPFGSGAKDVREIAPHLALVDQPSEAAGAGEYPQKRHLGQADRA